MSRLPIRLRVAAAFAVSMAAVLTGTGLFLYGRLDASLSHSLDRALRLRAQDMTTLLGQPNASLAGDRGRRFLPGDETYAEVLDARGRVVDSTRGLRKTPLLTATELRRAHRETIFANRDTTPGLDEPSRLLATPVERSGMPLVLVVGTTLEVQIDTLAGFRSELLIAGPIALILASLTGYLLAGLSLRQVDAMRRHAAAISAETPGERLPVPPTGDELERLGQTLNAMLDRLEHALRREREFVADAGHELRTPLALLRTELELALRQARSTDELKDAIRSSSSEADRLCRLAGDLLLIARSDRGQIPLRLERIDVTDLLRSTVSRFEWRSDEEGRPLHAEPAAGLYVHGDRLRLEQALGNLVDNALRHGQGAVRLSAERRNGQVELHVTDQGRGIQSEFLVHAFERFTRAESARSRSGSGLGLAIVQAIASAHQGTARLANTHPHGLDAWLTLPQDGFAS